MFKTRRTGRTSIHCIIQRKHAALLNPLITVMLHINNTSIVPTFNY